MKKESINNDKMEQAKRKTDNDGLKRSIAEKQKHVQQNKPVDK